MKKHKIHYQFLITVCLLIAALVLTTSQGAKIKKYRQSAMFFATEVHVDICYDRSQKDQVKHVVDMIWKRWEDIQWRMNVNDVHSDVAKVNGSYRSPVRVGADTYLMLQESLRFNQLTSGAFDITVWPLRQLWQESGKKDEWPSEEEVSRVKRSTGSRHIRLLPDYRVKILNKETKVDLNSIAAGYASDEAVRMLRKYGFENFLVGAGEKLFAAGLNCESEPWRIVLKDPLDQTKVLDILHVSNLAVTTLGDYQQFSVIKGEKFTHIIDPLTGYPEKKVASATVIAPTVAEADALATALCILDAEKGRGLIDRQGKGWASIVVTHEAEHFTRYESKDYPLYRIPQNL